MDACITIWWQRHPDTARNERTSVSRRLDQIIFYYGPDLVAQIPITKYYWAKQLTNIFQILSFFFSKSLLKASVSVSGFYLHFQNFCDKLAGVYHISSLWPLKIFNGGLCVAFLPSRFLTCRKSMVVSNWMVCSSVTFVVFGLQPFLSSEKRVPWCT